jgi:hypothetical protein
MLTGDSLGRARMQASPLLLPRPLVLASLTALWTGRYMEMASMGGRVVLQVVQMDATCYNRDFSGSRFTCGSVPDLRRLLSFLFLAGFFAAQQL